MVLRTEDAQQFVKWIQEDFGISTHRAKEIVNQLQCYLEEEETLLLYDLTYAIYSRSETSLAPKIVHTVLKFFTHLYGQEYYQPFRDELIKHYTNLQEKLFMQMLEHARQIEDRSDSARKILLHTSKRLSETLDTQELMIANISHEMRTVLNAIYGYLSIVQERGELRGEEKSYLDKASSATTNLKALVSDILNITKINSGQIEIVNESFWLDKMVLECADQIAMDLEKKSAIDLDIEIDFLPTKLYGDQNHIMEIIVNLLSNAVKYTDKGFVRLSVHHTPISEKLIEVTFRVEDSGIGIHPDQIEHIFSPYSRFKKERQGLGLGLHISRQLAKKLDGKLRVESTPGEGSRFEFVLKLRVDKHHSIDLTGKHIYFYIENKEAKNMLEKISFLQTHGANVTVFRNEARFINHLLTPSDIRPDFITIITDKKGYAKFDALIYYLKTLATYQQAIFIAEMNQGDISLSYFDRIFEYQAPLSTYMLTRKKYTDQSTQVKKRIAILAVDDTETNLEILRMFILKAFPNATVDMATGGYEAVGMFKIKSYDVVFLDLKMPGMDGFKVLEKLKQINDSPHIYAFTADVYKSNFDKVLHAGFDGLLEKPLQPGMLEKMIKKALDEKRDS